ncbi:MAG: ATP-grasp domain-containing protein [Chlorobi bacterium]|nr:ATP-grasp domain-containing protein [Chlorobiota bacterium]MCI0716242.1 ATP-grasp domain-containing protein [Chlorobiota bacterium]
MKVGFTYNIKKEIEHEEVQSSIKLNNRQKFIDSNLVENYSNRLSDIYAEWDDEETISAVEQAIQKAGHSVNRIEADENAFEKLKTIRPDIVFNMAEGLGGASRESHIPAMLEMLNIPYTASGPVTIGNCHDKSICKEILSYNGIPNPDFFITESIVNGYPKVKYPAFVKPLHEGSSKGIYNSSLVNNREQLNREITRIKQNYSQPSIIENFLDGREFTVAILGNGENVQVLPVIEINLSCLPKDFPKIYSYEVKWFFDTRENKLDIFTCPAKISESLTNKIEEICKKAYLALRIRDWARIDVRCDSKENPYIIEVNPLPGILPNPDDNSCFPKAARAVGMDYDTLIQTVLNLAIKRYGLNN